MFDIMQFIEVYNLTGVEKGWFPKRIVDKGNIKIPAFFN